MKKNQKGFTLVELLVVLAIIGVLVGLAIAGMRIVQAVNRDTQRKSFISKDVQLLLEAYQEKYYSYPDSISVATSSSCAANEKLVRVLSGSGTSIKYEEACSKVGFIVSTPVLCATTFTGEESQNGYLTMCYSGSGKGYSLKVKLERSTDPYDASNVDL